MSPPFFHGFFQCGRRRLLREGPVGFSPGRSLLVRRFQAGSQSESNSTGDKGELLREACLRKPSPSNRGKVLSEATQMRVSFLVTLPRPPHHRLRRSFSPGRSLLVRLFQTGLQIKTNLAGGKGGAQPLLLKSAPAACTAGGENFRSRFPAGGNFHSLRFSRPSAQLTVKNAKNR